MKNLYRSHIHCQIAQILSWKILYSGKFTPTPTPAFDLLKHYWMQQKDFDQTKSLKVVNWELME